MTCLVCITQVQLKYNENIERHINRYVVVTYRCFLLLKCLGSKARYVVYDRGKVCRAVETNVRETGRVGLGDTLHTYTQRKTDLKFKDG